MQPLGEKTNRTTSQDKKIMQPLGTKTSQIFGRKKSCNLTGQKNHASSQDKKKGETSQKNKIMQSLRTKKKSRNLSGPKKNPRNNNKSCILSGQTKVTPPLWTTKNLQTLLGQNKSRNLPGQTKITQHHVIILFWLPLGDKKITFFNNNAQFGPILAFLHLGP